MQEKYEELRANTNVQVGSSADDHLFLKTCGAWSEQGTIYGLSGEGPAMFEIPAKPMRSSGSMLSAYSSLLVTQLQDQLQTTQNELETAPACLHSTEEELRTTREALDAIRK